MYRYRFPAARTSSKLWLTLVAFCGAQKNVFCCCLRLGVLLSACLLFVLAPFCLFCERRTAAAHTHVQSSEVLSRRIKESKVECAFNFRLSDRFTELVMAVVDTLTGEPCSEARMQAATTRPRHAP